MHNPTDFDGDETIPGDPLLEDTAKRKRIDLSQAAQQETTASPALDETRRAELSEQTITTSPIPDEEPPINPLEDTNPSQVTPRPSLEPAAQAAQAEEDEGLSPAVIGGAIAGMTLLAALIIGGGVLLLGGLGGGGACQALDQGALTLEGGGSVAALPDETAPRVCASRISAADLTGGQAGRAFSGAAEAVPPFLELRSDVYALNPRGEGRFSVEVPIPAEADPLLLDLYTWDAEASAWQFLPAEIDAEAGLLRTDAGPANLAVFESLPTSPLISATLSEGLQLEPAQTGPLNIIMPGGLSLAADETIQGELAGGWDLAAPYRVVPVITAGEGETLSQILNDDQKRALHVDDLATLAANGDFDGVALDYQALTEADRAVYPQFLADLRARLAAENRILIVLLNAPEGDQETWGQGAFDWPAVGQAADLVVVTATPDPDEYAPEENAFDVLAWATTRIARQKIHFTLPVASAEPSEGDGYTSISFEEALALLGGPAPADPDADEFTAGQEVAFTLGENPIQADEATAAYVLALGEGDDAPRAWLVTASTLRARMDMAGRYHTGGVMLPGLLEGDGDERITTAISEFKVGSASSLPSSLDVAWTAQRGEDVAAQETLPLGEPFTFRPGEEGDYQVSAAVAGREVALGEPLALAVEAGVEVAEGPTPTPAPARPASGNNNNAPAPAASGGTDGGGFELGGQVPNSLGNSAQMQQAGMRWVKFQIKYTPGLDPGVAGAFVQAGQSAGYKVLLSMPGQPYPSSIDFNAYVEFIRGVARYQPDAIEVWNEMNIDFEWPAGQINPESYVNNMLAPAFNAIKAESPNTMVIIGALAPTGFDNDVNAWSDSRYVRGLAAAGAARYANCIGVHHNSGTTSPSARTGRSEGDHYSWYFQPTLEVYYNGMGGALPVCLTELGYLSPEGYGALPSNFSWAQNTTVAQQAAWLDEAANISRSLGYVRMMIIFNVGFTTWTATDPQAGFSIIRPDGSCPACVALGS